MARAVAGSLWTPEDRALLLALGQYEATLCTRCGHTRDTAWHPDNDGFFEVTAAVTCHACTALANHDAGPGDEHPVEYLTITDTRDYEASPLPPLQLAPVGDHPAAAPVADTRGDATLGG